MTFNGKWPPDRDELARLLGTSAILEGCALSTTTGTDLIVGEGRVTFNYIDTTNDLFRSSGVKIVSQITDNSPTLSGNIQYVYLTESLEIEYEGALSVATLPNPARIILGGIIINAGTIIEVINLTDTSQTNIPEAIRDLQYTIKPLRKSGMELWADGTNPLKIAVTAGEVLILSGFVRAAASGFSPNILSVPGFTGANYYYTWRDGVGGWDIDFTRTQVDPNQYDNGSGTLQSVANNRWTVQRLYLDRSLNFYIHYGQDQYRTLESAVSGLLADSFYKNPLTEFSYFAGYLLIKKGCTDIDDAANCKIIVPQFVNGEINVIT